MLKNRRMSRLLSLSMAFAMVFTMTFTEATAAAFAATKKPGEIKVKISLSRPTVNKKSKNVPDAICTLKWNKVKNAKEYRVYCNNKKIKSFKKGKKSYKCNITIDDMSKQNVVYVKAYNKKKTSTSHKYDLSRVSMAPSKDLVTARDADYYMDGNEYLGVKSFKADYLKYKEGLNPTSYYYDVAGVDSTFRASKDTWYNLLTTERPYLNEQGQMSSDKMSILNAWTKLTDSILEEGKNYTTYWGSYTNDYTGKGDRIDIDKDLNSTKSITRGGKSRDNSTTSGLKTDKNTFAEVMDVMKNQVANRIDHGALYGEKSKILGNANFNKASYLKEIKDKEYDDMLYVVATNVDENSWNVYKYSSHALVFYDFALEPITVDGLEEITDYPDSQEAYDNRIISSTDGKYTEAIVNHDANNNLSNTTSIGETVTESRAVSMSNSKQISYSETATFSWTHKFGDPKAVSNEISIGTGFTFQQAFEQAKTEETVSQVSKNTMSQTTTNIPPYTQVNIVKDNNKRNFDYRLDVPMRLTYKVALLNFCAQLYADTGTICNWMRNGYKRGSSVYFFGSDGDNGSTAVESLYNRVILDSVAGEKTYTFTGNDDDHDDDHFNSDKRIDWNRIKSDVLGNGVNNALRVLINNHPIATNGGRVEVQSNATTTSVSEPIPLYCLSVVGVSRDKLSSDQEVNMSCGKEYSINRNIAAIGYGVNPLNKTKGLYYGFDQFDGYWVICDSKGNEIQDNGLFTITDNIIKAGDKTGTGYITWRIDTNGDFYDHYKISVDGYRPVNKGEGGDKTMEIDAPVVVVNIN